ncbi:uncharacterized protein LOC110700741 [Chenopodium quinoa]|uniref:uncharacterized protein LOC110700741 n=1 Tax=Chenopodium quinoa TaxID=63459 RepID=UPI000B775288|nr:uncharacterized protein LOC110700741 [Chenopodium quinoa]
MSGLGSGLGAVVRDSLGNVRGCSSVQMMDVWETKIAEAKAIFWGLKLAQEMGLSRVEVESDCLPVIQALREKSSGSSSFHLVIEDIVNLCSSFAFVSWSFIKRDGNRVAHDLAHFQPWEVGQRMWIDVIPSRIVNLVTADLI